MQETKLQQWIVLLDKSPKGPLSTQELCALIEQGMLGPNDLAFAVSAGGDAAISGWKFLHQFEVFHQSLSTSPDLLRSPSPQKSPSHLSKTTYTGSSYRLRRETEVPKVLPEAFANIRPEELLFKTRATRQGELPLSESKSTKVPRVNLHRSASYEKPFYAKPAFFLILALCSIGFSSLYFLGTPTAKREVAQKKNAPQAPAPKAAPSTLPSASPLSGSVSKRSRSLNMDPSRMRKLQKGAPKRRSRRFDVDEKVAQPVPPREEMDEYDRREDRREDRELDREPKAAEEESEEREDEEREDEDRDRGEVGEIPDTEQIVDFGTGAVEAPVEPIDEEYFEGEAEEAYEDY